MARPWKAPQLLLAILVALMAHTYQTRKKTFILVQEVSAVEAYVPDTLQFVTDEYNRESDDEYNFRILRVLKILKKITDHLEYHIDVEMQRTTCKKLETKDCVLQKGELYKAFK
ncbi:PREDICTED: cystatin-11 [Galeopterus variegatus]|uniref:Cystatin-11 n=1 Tax=Galeopterus variegatus TaxID=482537 RepID=A0ABM0RQM1_GALVR|nr:PREDICTED: cystatin-11 [Galeopterus variegatus]